MLSIRVKTVFNQAQLQDMKRDYMAECKRRALLEKIDERVARNDQKQAYRTRVGVVHHPK